MARVIQNICLVISITLGSYNIIFCQITSIDSTSTSTIQKKNSFTSVFYGDPGKAALYSLIVPGAGQLYNKRWWKVPLVWAGEGYLIYNLIQSLDTYQTWDTCWKSFLDDDPTFICPSDNTPSTTTDAFAIRQSARSQREQAWIFLSIGHLINVFEAFIDRHLINFDVSENLTLKIQSTSSRYKSLCDIPVIRVPQIEIFTINIPLNGTSR